MRRPSPFVAIVALLVVAGVVAGVVAFVATNSHTRSSAAAAYARHVDATIETLDAFFENAEGGSREQFAYDSSFAAIEEAWIAAQPPLPCLAAAAAQYGAAIAALKAAMDISVDDYVSNNAAALASLSAKTDPVRPLLLSARDAVDQAAARC